jgi:hypothetical protein
MRVLTGYVIIALPPFPFQCPALKNDLEVIKEVVKGNRVLQIFLNLLR